MSQQELGDLFHHSQGEEEGTTPTDSQRQEQCQLNGAAYVVAVKNNNKDTDVDLNEDKDSSHENSVRVDNKKLYFKDKQFLKVKVVKKAGHVKVKGRDRFIQVHSKTELARSTVKGQVTQSISEHTAINRGHLSPEGGQSITEEQESMGSMVCGHSDLDDKTEKLQKGTKKKKLETSDDSCKAKRLSLNSDRNISNNRGKKIQTTLDQYDIRTRAAQKAHQEKTDKADLHKHFVDADTQGYRNGYPGKEDKPHLKDNLKFYRGEIRSNPKGAYIDEIHEDWWGNYELLERHHGYIQWLFPIRESGMNSQAQPLQLHEAKAIKADQQAKKRVLMSYKLMLDFYGMELADDRTGKLKRSKNWRKCFDNLNSSRHNYLRITRILKCLGELGFEHLKKGMLQFVLEEALIHKTLGATLASCRDYWIGTIKDDDDRMDLYQFIDEHQGGSRK